MMDCRSTDEQVVLALALAFKSLRSSETHITKYVKDSDKDKRLCSSDPARVSFTLRSHRSKQSRRSAEEGSSHISQLGHERFAHCNDDCLSCTQRPG